MKRKGSLILLRHGESTWNKLNLFTGWVDIPLSHKGVEESLAAGQFLKKFSIDRVFTSELIRAQMTACLAMINHPSGKVLCRQYPEESKMGKWGHIYNPETEKKVIPMMTAWELNERMYGRLQGLNKEEVKREFGEEQFKKWRRSFKEPPPEGESLQMTAQRTLPYFKKTLMPYLEKGETLLVSAHGNSLRALIMDMENLSEEAVVQLEIATGKPLVYTWDGSWRKETHA